jgi:YHS domain-containing protein
MTDKRIDPVCGAGIEASSAIHEKTGTGEHYFCSEACRNRFIVNPGRYASRG